MRKSGYKIVYELKGGILKWNEAQKALEKGNEVKANSLKMNEIDFQQKLLNNKVVLVDFGATWCRPCRMQAPILDSLALKEKSKFVLIKVDADQNREFLQKLQVSELPTLLLFKNGKQSWRGEGLMSAEMILDAINNK